MSQRYSRERVVYRTDRNAALAPEYIPERPRREEQRSRHAQVKEARRTELAGFTVTVLLTLVVAALAFFVVSRNAQIFSNQQKIRALANERTEKELQLRRAEVDYFADSELNAYFDMAENELALADPGANDIVTAVCPAVTEGLSDTEALPEQSVYDAVLDWVNALGRRIQSWA